ncbi:FAD-linked oxidoreductase [Agromyces rhizosphaerae]|uniref:FAD-linked oxidoreductase n=1 Tax=Agromyces rhizosphaerae TaxID=88374 RepID=A0A9W6CXU7_9MICO|nr:D-arabinono-1,4-lactone oxidase [Agromyces rhizosphaerae]GLI28315.1 FAD-linked oxidoreductase [Agromyces rhizosphaerae]
MTASGGTWRNWGRSERVRPRRVERPASPEAVQRAVEAAARSGLRIKPVGASHSFSGIAVAPDVQLDLDDLSGITAVDEATGRVTLRAGTRLFRLPELLAPLGLAMQNMGDIDRQSVAGATSTGTHGTGLGFGGLATRITGVRLVTGTGEFLTVNATENAELLPAVRLGLGALGVLVEVELELVPEFALHAAERPEPLDAVLESWTERVQGADHFEFYWFPHTSRVLTMTNTRMPLNAPLAPQHPLARFVDDELLANGAVGTVSVLGKIAPPLTPHAAKLVERALSSREWSDRSAKVYASRRAVRFREMEYALPLEEVPAAFAEVRALIERRGWRVSFPIEVRAAAPDDVWLSTAYQRPTGYIAVHRYYREDPTEYFAGVEEIMVAHGGRPHWGKMHTRTAEYLREAYPRFDDFLAVRDQLDPERRFTNPYLDRVLGA